MVMAGVGVRESLPLLSDPVWHARVKTGYARGWEPVRFVDNINNYRDVLVWLTGDPANQLRLVAARPVSGTPD